MNKQIRLLIENITDDIFNDGLLNTEDTYTTISNELFYNYHPKTKQELRKLLGHLFVERGKDADLNDIDVSNITDMSVLFNGLDPHNINIRHWDVSNVKDMECIFYVCYNFDCDLSGWDVSSVRIMNSMFDNCKKFTGKGLENWKSIKCIDMNCMFYNCVNFDCDLSGWDVSNVEDMGGMFYGCKNFIGRGLDEWKPIKCKNKIGMFDECSSLIKKPRWYKNKYLK